MAGMNKGMQHQYSVPGGIGANYNAGNDYNQNPMGLKKLTPARAMMPHNMNTKS
jgi:hypothetical protein